ncbi:MAG: hypothetical protein IPM63_01630 [Acidobacteriota bacterium]|nr:MAG: hypothetical protein IPM63_01630 [Acidobacteriota bacterium]
MLAYGGAAIFCALLAVFGLAYWRLGEHLEQERLAQAFSEQELAVVISENGGVACPECSEIGLTIILFSIAILVIALFICGAAEIVISKKERAAIDR